MKRLLWLAVLVFGLLLIFDFIGIFQPAKVIGIDNAIGLVLIAGAAWEMSKRGGRR